jgi:orotate phosphoribosyltransferase
MLQPYQRTFLDTALGRGVLRFGDFTLKSGRQSPYFFNMGRIDTGAALAAVGAAYADTIVANAIGFDMLFGPAYKGIPLAAATAIALARGHGRDVPWAYNRKEAKDHGEGGSLIGAPLVGRVLIVDDVISAGTAVRESIALIRAAGATPHALAIALDREEVAKENGQDVAWSAVQYVRETLGLQVCSVAHLSDLLRHLEGQPWEARHYQAVLAYRDRYGVRGGG